MQRLLRREKTIAIVVGIIILTMAWDLVSVGHLLPRSLIYPSWERVVDRFVHAILDNDTDALKRLAGNNADCLRDSQQAFTKLYKASTAIDPKYLQYTQYTADLLRSTQKSNEMTSLWVYNDLGMSEQVTITTTFSPWGFRYLCGVSDPYP